MDKPDHKRPDHKKIGLLGGSFNPAHEGHLEISLAALDNIGLEEIWWLVTPSNPLKGDEDQNTYDQRFKSALNIVNDDRIIVSDLEKKLDTRFTVDTIKELKSEYSNYDFVWLMGADNLAQFDQWKEWKTIANTVPIAIFNRPSYSKANNDSIAAKALQEFKIDQADIRNLYKLKPPAWSFYEATHNPTSSTALRNKIK
jgi:nicotinate-nucleotide adenylyltransferase